MSGDIAVQVINLVSRPDRRILVRDNLRDLPLPWSFFDGSLADSPCFVSPNPHRQLVRFGRLLTPSEIGCAKSHLTLLRSFVDEGAANWLLVLEDDLWVDCEFDFTALAELCRSNGISYIRLYSKYWKPARHLGTWRTRHLIRFVTDPYGTQAYLIDRAAAARFLATVSSIDLPVDDEMGRFWVNGLAPYALYPFPVIERCSTSAIEAERTSAQATHSARPPSLARLGYRVLSRIRKAMENWQLSSRDIRLARRLA